MKLNQEIDIAELFPVFSKFEDIEPPDGPMLTGFEADALYQLDCQELGPFSLLF